MDSRQYHVSIEGQTPLLMHQDNLVWAETMKRWGEDPSNKKFSVAGDDRTPAWRWIGNLYFDAGMVCIPSDNLMTMLREGGSKCPTGKRGGTYKRQTQSGIVIDQPAWTIKGTKGTIPTAEIQKLIENPDFEAHGKKASELGFDLFVKRAKIGNSKHVRVRPRFDKWSCEGTLTVFEETITTAVLKNILDFAGVYAGLCDWRPSSPKSPGSWGKFTCTVKAV